PVPQWPWLQGQTWRDLLFAHWSLPAERLGGVVPAALELDTYEDRAWIAITPFEVTGLRLHGLPPPPVLSRFEETNVRTYVTVSLGRVWRAEIHHAPWTLQRADAAIAENTMTVPAGIDLPPEDPVLHYAARQDVVIWPLCLAGPAA